jgi:nicotinamidase-related amidase
MSSYTFQYKLDPEGPKGIAIDSWLDRTKLGLVLVDYQNYWLDDSFGSESEIVWKTDSTKNYVFDRYRNIVLPNTLKLINLFRNLNLRIVYLRNASFDKNLQDIKGVLKKVYAYELKDTKGNIYHMNADEYASQIVADLAPENGDIVISKTSMGAFAASDIERILRSNGIEALVFAGGYTDACISSTVRGAYDRGFLCTVIEDACISNIEEDHKATIRILEKYFAWVISATDLIEEISKR